MSEYDGAFQITVGLEGGYSNDPADPGGETIYGIARNRWPDMWANGTPTLDAAKRFYKAKFWDPLHGDEIATIAPNIADKLFDIAVNCGLQEAGLFLQRALNVFNKRGKDYPDVAVDGEVGGATVAALRAYFVRRAMQKGEQVMHEALSAQQGVHYMQIAQRNPAEEDFEYGWFLERVLL